MARITTNEYPVTPTMRFVDAEGRLTGEGFRLIKAVSDVVQAITIEDGEVKASMISVVSLEAISAVLGNVQVTGNLMVDGSLTTGKHASRSITDVTVALQVFPQGPNSPYIVQGVPVADDPDITGVLIDFVAFMDRPALDAGNVGYWRLFPKRNGVEFDTTPDLFYDDNFAYPVVARWFDETPGLNPTYIINGELLSGLGDFTIAGGIAIFTLLKR